MMMSGIHYVLACLAVVGKVSAGFIGLVDWDDLSGNVKPDAGDDCGIYYSECMAECAPGGRYRVKCMQKRSATGVDKIKLHECLCRVAGGRPNSAYPVEFSHEMVLAHDKYRKMHGIRLLDQSDYLKYYSDIHASTLAQEGEARHSDEYATDGSDMIGENIYVFEGATLPDPEVIVKSWYDEIINYNYGEEEPETSESAPWDHFSQVVWRKSRIAGCAKAQGHGKWFVVCQYDPKGNLDGYYTANVLPVATDQCEVQK